MDRAPGYEPREFRPVPGLANPHAQTLIGRWIRRPRGPLPFRRRRIPTPDGDFLDLDFWEPDPVPARPAGHGSDRPDPGRRDRPLVLVLHGLEGSSRSGYVVESCRSLGRSGARPVVLNFRGCSGTPNRKARFYHSGETGDLAHALAWLRTRWPGVPVGALGFSLGGNVLLKYLGQRGSEVRGTIRRAAAVSVPVDLSASAASLESGMGRVYARFFLSSLRRKVRLKARRHPHAFDLRAAERAGSLREFDDAVTAPLHGFRDAEHYYRQSSAARYLDGVRIPTLLVHAADDPLAPAEGLPLDELRSHRWIVPHLTPAGGHVGFVERRGAGLAPWAEPETARYLSSRLMAAGDSGQPSASGRRQTAGRRSEGPASPA